MSLSASSALRDDSADDGSGYGSLAGLGGPRKLKKKPVLVLAPEELEAAHAMFHEASAELLGEDVERAPRPATVLGLAPMLDDDPEELGESDEPIADDGDDEPSAEDVLALTRRKTPALPPIDEPLETSEADGSFEEYASESGPPQDDIDLSTRIFPSLPIQPDLVEDDEPVEAQVDAELAPERPEKVCQDAAPTNSIPLPTDPDALLSHYRIPEPPRRPAVAAARAETPRPSALAALRARHEAAQRSDEPVARAPLAAPPPQPPVQNEPAGTTTPAPAPARFDELPPNKDYDTPDDGFDLDAWLSEDSPAQPLEDAARPVAFPEYDTFEAKTASEEWSKAEPAIETTEEPQDSYTVTDDADMVDGKAFMRESRSRRGAVESTPHGRQSALRAKLLREAEEQAPIEPARPQSRSLFVTLWRKLTGRG